MGSASVATITCGTPGAGKSYFMVRHLVTELLPNSDAVIFTNLPVDIDAIVEALQGKVTEDDVRRRLVPIPKATLASWHREIPVEDDKKAMVCESGPWDFLAEQNITEANVVIILDECDAWIGTDATKATKEKWRHWVSELRHVGARVEFLVQDWKNVYSAINRFCQLRNYIVNEEEARDPFFGIPLQDWYNLRGGITRTYKPRVVCRLERRVGPDSWERVERLTYVLESRIWKLYSSYNDPVKVKGKGVGGKVYEFQKRHLPGLCVWFLRRNWYRLGLRFGMAGIFIWLFFFGGFVFCLNQFMHYMQVGVAAQRNAVAAAGKEAEQSDVSPALVSKSQIVPGSVVAVNGIPVSAESQGSVVGVPRPSVAEVIANSPDRSLAVKHLPPGVVNQETPVPVEQDEPFVMMRSEVGDLIGTLEEQRDELIALRKQVAGAESGVYVAGITRKRVILSDGAQLRVGDILGGTKHAGQRISQIDFQNRVVRTDSGGVLRVGMPVGGKDIGVSLANIPGTVRSVASGSDK